MNRHFTSRPEREYRRKEMKKMRLEGKTLQEIADLFDTCRQHVTYLIGKTGRNFRKELTETVANEIDFSQLTRNEVKQMTGMKTVLLSALAAVHHKNTRNGNSEEEIASRLLNDFGIENSLMAYLHPFDILTKNGKRIDVKHADNPIKDYPYSRHISPFYRMSKLKGGKDCDYFMAMIPDKKEIYGYAIFIVPSSLSPKGKDSSIAIPWPQYSKRVSKWCQFKDRFDLLK